MTPQPIETVSLTKQYGNTVGVDGLDINVEQNNVYGFLGPNGAGKSTTIDMLAGYIHPTSGTARVLGYDPWDEAVELHRRMGVLPDDFDVYDGVSARRHLSLAIDTHGSDEDSLKLLGRVGLREVAGEDAGEFSEGMKQRLALALALVGNPELLLLDEPFTGLDPHGVKRVRNIVRTEVDRGATLLVSSHILGEIEPLCDSVGIVHGGRVVGQGTLESIRMERNLPEDASLEDIILELTESNIRMEGFD